VFNIQQFKSAMETYEKAVNDPFAGSLGNLWLEYARFAEERGKLRTAQSVYLRALVGTAGSDPPAVTQEQDCNLMWTEFLDMMRRTNNDPTLSMDDLKQAVEKEHIFKEAQPEPVASTKGLHDDDEQDLPPPEKRMRVESPMVNIDTKTHVVTPDAVEVEKDGLVGMTSQLPSEVSAAWFARDGDSQPVAPPPLFSPSPPKLSDPTGRVLLGDELALEVIERLLEDSGTILLESCRGLWMLSALKENEVAQSIEQLDKSMVISYG
jgi:hypothetical protein